FFLGHLVGHGEHAAITLDRSGHGQPDSGIPAGRFHDGPAGLQSAVRLRRFDDCNTDSVFYGATRVLVLALRVNGGPHPGADPRQADQRGAPDGIEDRFVRCQMLGVLHTPTFSPAGSGTESAAGTPSRRGYRCAWPARNGAEEPRPAPPSRV